MTWGGGDVVCRHVVATSISGEDLFIVNPQQLYAVLKSVNHPSGGGV